MEDFGGFGGVGRVDLVGGLGGGCKGRRELGFECLLQGLQKRVSGGFAFMGPVSH